MKRFYKMLVFLISMALSVFFCDLLKVQAMNIGEGTMSEFLKFEQELINLNKKSSLSGFSIGEENEIESDSEFALKRLIVNGKLNDTYGAIKKVSYGDLSVLCYMNERDTQLAYEKLSQNKELSVVIDKVEKLEQYAEKEYDYSSYDNWGAKSIDIGGYREFLVDNNVNKEVVVVVLDTGINTSHPMFENRLVTDSNGKIRGFSYHDSTYRYSYNNLAFDSDDNNKYSFEDDHGHGSHVSGIIAGLTPENVKILNIKIGDVDGYSSTDIMLSAYLRVINIYSKEYNIVATNLSFSGGGKNSESAKNTFNEQCYNPLLELNILPITSAGNDSEENNLEGLNAVVVSALENRSDYAVFDRAYSNYGKIVDISAPGSNVKSAGISKTDGENSSIVSKSGTSMASPQVAAVVALLSLNPNLANDVTALDIEQLLYDNAVDESYLGGYSLGIGEQGKDIYYGEGILNLKYFESRKTETLSFYEDGLLINEYKFHQNFIDSFNLEIKCSNPDFKIIYTTNKKIPTFINHLEYTSKISVQESLELYAMGVKIVDGEIVERTDLYDISYFYDLTPLEECFTISGSGMLYDYSCYFKELVIPETINGKTITGMGYGTFEYANFERITLPSTITRISSFGFAYNGSLKYIYAPGVTSILEAAFGDCISLKSVVDSHPGTNEIEGAFFPSLEEMEGYVFQNCKNLESVSLFNLTSLGGRGIAFYKCSKLSYVYLPNITSIPKNTFYMCTNLKGEFYVGKNVAYIGESAFRGTQLQKIVVDENNKHFYTDGQGLYSTSALVGFANGNKNIDYEILSSVEIDGKKSTITTIGEYTINNTELNELTIPDSIEIIEGFAFYETIINKLYYNAVNCSSSGYMDEEGFRSVIFKEIKVLEIGENVKQVPERLFERTNFTSLIINSRKTIFVTSKLATSGFLKKLVLNFNESIDNDYIQMLSSDFKLTLSYIDLLYVKNSLNDDVRNIMSQLKYVSLDGEYIVYSRQRLSNSDPDLEIYVITASSSGGGTINPSGNVFVKEGEQQHFDFMPNVGVKIKDILIDGVELEGNELQLAINEGYTFSNVQENHTIVVVFDVECHDVLVIREFEDNENLNYESTIEIIDGNSFILLYEEKGSFVLKKMEIDGVDYNFKENFYYYNTTCFVSIKNIISDMTVRLSYGLKEYTIKASLEGEGKITPSGDVLVKHGYNQKFEIEVVEGYHVENIFIGSMSLSEDEIESVLENGYTFTNVTSDSSIRVVVVKNEKIKYKIYAKVEGNGTISPSGEVEVIEGESKHFVFTPSEGYKIKAILIDDQYLSDSLLEEAMNEGYVFENVVSEHSIKVVFEEIKYNVHSIHEFENASYLNYENDVQLPHGTGISKHYVLYQKYIMSYLEVNGKSVNILDNLICDLNDKCYVSVKNITEDIEIYAKYKLKRYIIEASLEGQGAITPKGNVVVKYGQNQKFEIEVVEGYHVENIFIGSMSLSEDEIESVLEHGYTFINVTENNSIKVIVVEDVKVKHTIFAKVEGKGTISPSGAIEVIEGGQQHFTFTPSEGYRVSSVLIDNEYLSDALLEKAINEGYTFVNVKATHLIKVNFEKKSYNVHVIREFEDGNIQESMMSVRYGNAVSLLQEYSEYFSLKRVIVNGEEYNFEKNLYCDKEIWFVRIDEVSKDLEVHMIYEFKNYIIEASLEGAGSITPKGDVVVKHGENQKFEIEVLEGYHVENIFIGSMSLNEKEIARVLLNGYIFINVTGNNSIRVIVAEDVEYKIFAQAEGDGSITPSGMVEVMKGEQKHFMFVPDEGYQVSRVIVDGEELVKDELQLAINEGYIFANVEENHTIKVVFVKKKYVIQASLEGYGAITPKGNVVVEHGTNQKFEIEVVEGYHVESVFIGSVSLPEYIIDNLLDNGYTFMNISGNNSIRVIVVENEPEKHKIVAQVDGEGTITPSGEIEVIEGEQQHFTFTPSEGCKVKAVIIDGVYLSDLLLEEAINEGYIFNDVRGNHTIKVVMEALPKFKIEVLILGEGSFDSETDLSAVGIGENVSIKFIAKEGYVLDKVWVNQEEINIDGDTLDIIGVSEDVNIVASFDKNEIQIDSGNITINGLSCSKGEDGGSIFDFLFIVLTMFGFAIPRRKLFFK